MHYAIEVVPFGEYADPLNVVRLAQAAEAAGWEGLFVWDHLSYNLGYPAGDPWVILSAVASTTTSLKVGVEVCPLPRRRPHVLAQTLTTLDLLSQGRVIFSAGLGGVPEEFSAFGEPADPKIRAAKLDEGLQVLDGLLRGETVTHHGLYYTVEGIAMGTPCVQKPRPPIWIGGESRPALRRAARWDGWVIGGVDIECKMTKTPQQLADQVAYIQEHRTDSRPFDVAITGCSMIDQGLLTREYEAAGATWWLESLFGIRGSIGEMLARAKAGPPK